MNPKAPKAAPKQALLQQENEHLILLEFFVERVVFNDVLDPKLKNGKTIVDFQFMENDPILLENQNDKTDVELCAKESFNLGKTCLFSLTPEEAAEVSTLFDIYVRVYKHAKCGKPQNVLVGIALIPLTDQCNKIIKKAGDKKSDSSPGACEYLKNSFPLHGLESNQPIGHICVSVRINCYGKYIQTDFQMNMEQKSIDYKANEAQYRLKYHKKFVPCPDKCPQPNTVPCADPAVCCAPKTTINSTNTSECPCNGDIQNAAALSTCPGKCGNQTTSATSPLEPSAALGPKTSKTAPSTKPAKSKKSIKSNKKTNKKGKGDKKKQGEGKTDEPPAVLSPPPVQEQVCTSQCPYSPNYQPPMPPPPPCCPPPPPCCPPPPCPLPPCTRCCKPPAPPPNLCPVCQSQVTKPKPPQPSCNCKSETPVTMVYASEPNYNPNPPTNNFLMDMGLGGSLCCRIHEEQVPEKVPCPVNYMSPPTISGKCPFPCSQNKANDQNSGCPPCMRPKQATIVEMGPGPANKPPFRFSVGDGAIDQNQLCVSPPTYTAVDGTNYTEISDPNKQVFLMRIGKKFDGVLGGRNNVDLHLTTPPPPLADAELENRAQQYNISDTPPGAIYALGSQVQAVSNMDGPDPVSKNKTDKSTQKIKGGKGKKK